MAVDLSKGRSLPMRITTNLSGRSLKKHCTMLLTRSASLWHLPA